MTRSSVTNPARSEAVSALLGSTPERASRRREPAADHAAPKPLLQRPRLPVSARVVLSMLERLEQGQLTVHTPEGQTLVFGQGGIEAEIRLADWSVCGACLGRGDVGFAETWIAGSWDTADLPALLSLLALNRRTIEQALYGGFWGRLIGRVKHAFNRNTRAGSRRNIHAHYDLGNDFYRQWLDGSMTYSSALFEGDPHQPLEQAQHAKYRRILDRLALPAGARVLEIGCGWGGFAELAARDGLQVTGLTLSAEQLAWARDRLARAGLSHQSEFHLRDYRDERGRYDAIVSIEMFEAVGQSYWPDYFRTLSRCLKPQGRALVQTIVIDDALFERYRRSTDFIQQYIFPGGMLPSAPVFESEAAAAGLAVVDRFAFGSDYARTLALWRERFLRLWPQIAPLGFDRRFARTWEFYLAYCQAGFEQASTDVLQFELQATGA